MYWLTMALTVSKHIVSIYLFLLTDVSFNNSSFLCHLSIVFSPFLNIFVSSASPAAVISSVSSVVHNVIIGYQISRLLLCVIWRTDISA